MKDILVVAKLKEVWEVYGLYAIWKGMNERKIADLTKTLGTILDKGAVMFKMAVHNEDALNSFLDGSNRYLNQFSMM